VERLTTQLGTATKQCSDFLTLAKRLKKAQPAKAGQLTSSEVLTAIQSMSILEKIHEMNGAKEPLPPSKIQRPVLLMLSTTPQEGPKKTEAAVKAE